MALSGQLGLAEPAGPEASNQETSEERGGREQEAAAHLQAQLKEAEGAMQTCIAAAKQASQRADAERRRLQLTAGIAQVSLSLSDSL